MTRYVVLQRMVEAGAPAFVVFSGSDKDNPVEAHEARAAIRAAVDREVEANADFEPAGEYVAVPFASWKPLELAIETKRLFKLG